MVNPYTGIITSALKTTFNNMIDAVIEAGACSIPCEITYGGQRFTNCVNCQGGIYAPGGPIPFPNGMVCPLCQGTNKIESVETESVDLLCIFDSKKWRGLNVSDPSTFNMYAQTMSLLSLYPKLKAAKHIILDSDNKLYMRNVYKRYGEPEPCGFGDMRYIITSWERVN